MASTTCYGNTPQSKCTENRSFQFYFLLLPNELRDVVWESAISMAAPRIVELNMAVYKGKRSRSKSKQGKSQTSPKYPIPPALLHACQRSRELASRHWELCVAQHCPRQLNGEAKIYFAMASDNLYLHNSSGTIRDYNLRSWLRFMATCGTVMDTTRVETLTINSAGAEERLDLTFQTMAFTLPTAFPALRQLYIVLEQQHMDFGSLALTQCLQYLHLIRDRLRAGPFKISLVDNNKMDFANARPVEFNSDMSLDRFIQYHMAVITGSWTWSALCENVW